MEDALQWKTTSTPIEDDLKILKVEYLSNHWSDLPQILNLSSGDQTKIKMLEIKTTSNGRRPQNMKSGISQKDRNLWVLRGKLEENSEEISSLALLSPACLIKNLKYLALMTCGRIKHMFGLIFIHWKSGNTHKLTISRPVCEHCLMSIYNYVEHIL